MLELAYWIGPHLGVWNPAQDPHWNLAQYRDRRTTGRNELNMRVLFGNGGHTHAWLCK
jgi:hypothetical protein